MFLVRYKEDGEWYKSTFETSRGAKQFAVTFDGETEYRGEMKQ